MNGHDPMDYDGMGNHGRFPPEDLNKKSNTSRVDLVLIIVVVLIPVLLYIIK